MESWLQSWWPRTNAFCNFSSPCLWSMALATKRWCQVIRSAAPVTQNHLNKPEDLMLQIATPLRKSTPGPPNSSDEHVSCTALTFEKVHNPLRLPRETTSERPKVVRTWCVFNILTSKCVSSYNGVRFFDITTSKSGPNVVCFVHFWVGNVLRATMVCTFSTSQLPKVDRTWCALCILTWKCASRHNRMHFFIISTPKSGPNLDLVCFVHFDFEMCFAPQPCALLRHHNFQKWSKHDVFCAFWLGNVLRATRACTFSTSERPKVVRTWCVLYILTSKCASRHEGVQLFISHLGQLAPHPPL